MSFGWSVGDVIAGLKIVYDVWGAVSDGPLNAHYEATQFFDEFLFVVSRLEDWERRKPAWANDAALAASNQQLKDRCTLFIKRHMSLMQKVNPNTKAIKQGRSTWLQKAAFSRNQVRSLYQQVSWPFEREEVGDLREKLQFFLQIATHDVVRNIDNDMQGMKKQLTSHAELVSSNIKLVSSHLDLVSLVTLNLKRVTYPLESGHQAREIDYPMLRQFEQALRPPQPLQALEGHSSRAALLFSPRNNSNDAPYPTINSAPYNRDTGSFDQNDVRGLISRRLDNMSMRIGRVDTLDSISESGENVSSTTQPLLERLRDMRDQIGNAVGIHNRPVSQMPAVVIEPESALRQELEAWNQLEERIEREILHPGHLLGQVPEHQARSMPMQIPKRRSTPSLSPGSSPPEGDWLEPQIGSPGSGGSLSSSPNLSRLDSHSRSGSMFSATPPQSLRLDHYLPVQVTYPNKHPNHVVNAVIHTITRLEDGEVHSITATSLDGTTGIRHSVDLKAPETSMKPFLDNSHVDKTHKFRVQFQGAHSLKITKHVNKVSRYQCPPIYKFQNSGDFREFQNLLLNKEVKHTANVKSIKSTNDDEAQCRQGTLRILLDPFGIRSILYFRHTDQKHDFVEWPVNIFKDPKGPSKKGKTLTLDSLDGKALSVNKGMVSRQSTQGSVATIASFESSAGAAFSRMGEKEKAKIRGLVVEFYEPSECHDFWKEFRIKEVAPFPSPTKNGLGFTFPVELP